MLPRARQGPRGAFVVILGAEINSELERQTVKDSTEGESKPMGERGAFSADTLGSAARQK